MPLSVLLNVHEFGLGTHEAGLMLALGVGPHIFEGLIQARALTAILLTDNCCFFFITCILF